MNSKSDKQDIFGEGLTDTKKEDGDPTEGVEELVKMPKEFKDIEGETFEIPTPNWGMELQVIRSIGRLLKEVKDDIDVPLSELPELAKDKEKLTPIIITMLEKAPDEVTKIIARIINKDEAFVKEKLDMMILIEILIPFFVTRMTHLTQSMKRMDGNFEQLMQGLSASQSGGTRKKKSH